MDTLLDRLAEQHGINATRPSPQNVEIPIEAEVKRKLLAALGVPFNGLQSMPDPQKDISGFARAIPRSYVPEFLKNQRIWGISLQLYELRSDRNWGIGDFQDLAELAKFAAGLGADFIGLNPLHAPFLANPERCSPYEPSNRQMLNPLYIAVDKVAGFERDPELLRSLLGIRQSALVDYQAVADVKITALRRLWDSFRSSGFPHPDAAAFQDFVQERGEPLRKHALFESLSFHMLKQSRGTGWKSWPAEYRRPDSAEVGQFAEAHRDEIKFHMWLQWLAHQQLGNAVAAAKEAGMRIGLYLDLAVGEAIDGSATWSEPEVYISEATVGSPPDPFAPQGQDWHLAAIHPRKIAAGDHAPFKRMVEAAMRYAGAIRIDHAAALRRLFLVPVDSAPDGGAYVNYPQLDLMQILSTASDKFRCVVIGEDLGVLPEGLQDDLVEGQILSYKILSYERDEEGFKPADSYPQLSLACISTHDHQTLTGWWRGADIVAREEHGIVSPEISAQHEEERESEREELTGALKQAAVDPPIRQPSAKANDAKLEELVISAHRFIAKAPSLMVAVRLADMTGEKQPTNIPGTSDTYPNWKPKLSVKIENLKDVELLVNIARVVNEERNAE